MKVKVFWLMLLLLRTSVIYVTPINSSLVTTSEMITSGSESTRAITAKISSIKTTTNLENQNHKNFLLNLTNNINNYLNIRHQKQDTIFPFNILLNFHKKRETAENYVVSPCYKFEYGDPEMNTFYSPNYPDNYPRNIDCVRILEAPEDQLIKLDFRNSFNIEDKEDCKFDYLEIRDGPYGYSNEIGKFCGERFPDIITSRGRHLWLHFHSDDSIEYSGFTAVYEFRKPEGAVIQELNCTIHKGGHDGYLNSTDVPTDVLEKVRNDKIPLDCMWVIKVREGWKIQIKFLKFSLEKPNDCDVNFVDIFKENTDMNSRMKNFCGSAGDSVSSENNVLHIRFFADSTAIKSEFSILYTAFREKTASCEDDEYDCEDATCISSELECNGRDNCKFRWDEDGCFDQKHTQSEHVIIIIIVFALILGGMVITFLVNCIRKLLKDQKIIREHIRQSKESKLDEMGRASAVHSKERLAVKLSPHEKHSPSSFQILDDVSNPYYREIISVQNNITDRKKSDSILNQQHRDILVQTSLVEESTSTPDKKTCEMACQTRESLFQPVFQQQKPVTTPLPLQSMAPIRFSTFGYDVLPSLLSNKYTLQKQGTKKSRIAVTSTTKSEDRGMVKSLQQQQQQQTIETCHHLHHQARQHYEQPKQKEQICHEQYEHYRHISSGKRKHETQINESKTSNDIRNSAPDVIIMTSH